MLETKIYIGLNDADTMKQERSTNTFVDELKQVCIDAGIPFSFAIQQGGYIHEDGRYTQELTLVLSLIDVERKKANAVAKELCERFNQESVLITEDYVRAYFVSDDEDD